MGNITRISSGSLAKSNKVNQLIDKLNALENMTVRPGEGEEQPSLVVSDNNSELITAPGGSGGTGGGLPEFPSDVPDVPDFKGVLMWSVAENAPLWLSGEPVAEAEETSYIDVTIYDPDPLVDNFSLKRMEYLDVIICEDGSPVHGKMFFERDDPQP